MSIEIKKTRFSSPLGQAAYALRVEVFVDEQHVPPEVERDEYDDEALHLVATEEGRVVGTLRIVMLPDGAAKIGRVAVRKSHRMHGVGRTLMLAAIGHLREQRVAKAKLTSQVAVIGFYEKLGFSAHGPVFDEAGIPHRAMAMDL